MDRGIPFGTEGRDPNEERLLRQFHRARDRADVAEARRLAEQLVAISDDYQGCLDEADDLDDQGPKGSAICMSCDRYSEPEEDGSCPHCGGHMTTRRSR